MKQLRDSASVFKESNTVVLGVSAGSVSSHQEFCDELNLPFDLLSDGKGTVRKAYGFTRLSRAFILIDKTGTIRYVNKRYRLKKEEWQELIAEIEALKKYTTHGGNCRVCRSPDTL